MSSLKNREEYVSSFFSFALLSERKKERERARRKESKSYPLPTWNKSTWFLFSSCNSHIQKNKKKRHREKGERNRESFCCAEENFRCQKIHFYVNPNTIIIYFNRMLSIVVLVLLIDQFQPAYQLETVQTALSSTVELPCSNANQNIDSRNSAKVTMAYSFIWLERKNSFPLRE